MRCRAQFTFYTTAKATFLERAYLQAGVTMPMRRYQWLHGLDYVRACVRMLDVKRDDKSRFFRLAKQHRVRSLIYLKYLRYLTYLNNAHL